MRAPLATLLALLAATFVVPVSPADGASTTTETEAALTWSGFDDMVVDQAHGYVFISGTSSGVLVTDLDGHQVGSISGLGHTDGMTLSDDGATLFVTAPAQHEVAQIDAAAPLATDAVTTYSTGAACPVDVATSAGLVWFADACHEVDPVALDYLVLGTGTTAQAVATTIDFAGISATPALPGEVFVSGDGDLARYDVTGGATPSATLDVAQTVSVGSDVSFTPDGSEIVTDTAHLLSSSTLKSHGRIRLGGGAIAWATAVRSSDGTFAVASRHLTGHVPDQVDVFRAGSRERFRTYSFPEHTLAGRSVAFGDTNLYVVDETEAGDDRLQVVVPRPQPTLAVSTDRSSYRFRQRVTVTAVLGAGAAVQRVALYVQHSGHARHLLRSGQVDAKGRLIAHTRLIRKATFTAVVAGNDTVDGNTATAQVHVGAKLTGKALHPIRRVGRYAFYRPGSTARFLGRIQPRKLGCISFELGLRLERGWTDSSTKCFPTRRGRVEVRIPFKPAYLAAPIRIKVWWSGRGTSGGASRWYYLEFRS